MTRQGWQHSLAAAAICALMVGCQTASHDGACGGTRLDHDAAAPPVISLQRLPAVHAPTSSVALASYEAAEELPAPSGHDRMPPVPKEIPASDPLQLREVVLSVQTSYPLLLAAMLERTIADGESISAWGEFDLDAKLFAIAAPQGYYQTYRNGIAADQPLFCGGYVYGGYKIGDGYFQPWFKERETDEGGEFSAGFGVPLLKDRSIDKRRAGVFQAGLARQAVEPVVRAQMLEFIRVASKAYWSWIAAGQNLRAQRELLGNAQDRVRQIEEKVNAGDLPQIARINNQQLIAARETKVIEAERKLEQSAIKLSLFFRGSTGDPIVPHESQLPPTFPTSSPWDADQVAADVAAAVAASPLLVDLDLAAEQLRIELQNAQNMLLPQLDARLLASKDVGAPADLKRNKTPFELEAGLYGELPLQRREARGKVTSVQGKLAQLAAKRQFVVDKITAAIQDATSALQAASGRIDRAETNLRLARQTLDLGRLQFDEGDIDLISLNIYEKAVTDAQLLLISAQADFFSALADYRAALARDPLAAE